MLESQLLSLRQSPLEEIEKVYRFWRRCWGQEFIESGLNGIDTKNSDDFRSSDLIRTVLVDGELAALMLVNEFDLGKDWDRTFSYFNQWPEEMFAFVQHSKVIACRYFLVAPEFRKFPRLRLGPTVVALCLEDFLRSDSVYLLGMVLKRFGAHNLVSKFGIRPVCEGEKTKHGVGVEYVFTDKNMLNRQKIRDLTSRVFDQGQGRALERRREDLDGVVRDYESLDFA